MLAPALACRLELLVARREDRRLAPLELVVGTPAFMSPEQAEGRVEVLDPRSDVYCLGAMLYNLLTGQPPYIPRGARVSPRTVLAQVLQGPPRPVGDVDPRAPTEVVSICEKAMARRLEDRYGSSLALAQDLQAFLDQRVVKAYRTGAVVELRKWVARNRATAASIALAVLLAIAGLAAVIAVRERAFDELAEETTLKEEALSRATGAEAHLTGERDAAKRNLALAFLGKGEAAIEKQDWAAGALYAAASIGELDTPAARTLLYRAESRARPPKWSTPTGTPVRVAWSPDGTLLAADTGEVSTMWIDMWDAETGAHGGRLLPQRRPGPWPIIFRESDETPSPLVFTPGGESLILVGGDDGSYVWDVASGAPLRQLPPARLVAVAPAGSRAALVTERMILVIDPATGRELAVHEVGDDPPLDVAFTADGSLVAAVYERRPGAVVVREPASGREVARFPAGRFLRPALSPDATRVALIDPEGDRPIRVFDVETAALVGVVEAPPGRDVVLAWSPDAALLASSGADDTAIRVHRVDTGAEVSRLAGHTDNVTSIPFRPGGKDLASASRDDSLRVWDLASGRERLRLQGYSTGLFAPGVPALAFTEEGKRLLVATYERPPRVLDARNGRTLSRLEGTTPAAFTSDGRLAASTDEASGTISITDTRTGAVTARLREPGARALDLAFAAEGASLVDRVEKDDRNAVLIWDISRERRILRVESRGFTLTPDGSRLAALTDENALVLHDTGTGRQVAALPLEEGSPGVL